MKKATMAKSSVRREVARCKAMEELGCRKKNIYKSFCTIFFVTLFLISFYQLCNYKVVETEEKPSENKVDTVQNITEDISYIFFDEKLPTGKSPNLEKLVEDFAKSETSAENLATSETFVEDLAKSETPVEDLAEPETLVEEVPETNDELEEIESVVSMEEENNEEFIISFDQKELGMIVQTVQHEVGAFENFYPDADLDVIQQCMTRVIINRVGRSGYGFHDTVYEVLTHPGQFVPLEELEPIDPAEPRTLSNVLTVLRGEDNISKDIIFEMSFPVPDLEQAEEIMENQVGPVNIYLSTITAEGRLLVFAEPATN